MRVARTVVLPLLLAAGCAAREEAPPPAPEAPVADPFPVRFPPLSINAAGLEPAAKDGRPFREERDGVLLSLLEYQVASSEHGPSYRVRVENKGSDDVRVDFAEFRLQPSFDPRWLRPRIADPHGEVQTLEPGEATTRVLEFNVRWSEPRRAVLKASGISRGSPPRVVEFSIDLDAL